MTALPKGWDESAERIARMCASRSWAGATLTHAERVDAAGIGISEHLADHLWAADPKGDNRRPPGRELRHRTRERGRTSA